MRTKITVQRRKGKALSPVYFSYKKGKTFKSFSSRFVGWKEWCPDDTSNGAYRGFFPEDKSAYCGVYSVINHGENKYKGILDVLVSLYDVSVYK